MELFLLSVIVIFVAVFCFALSGGKKYEEFLKLMNETGVNIHKTSGMNASDTVVGFRKSTKEVMLGTIEKPVFIPYSDVIGCELKTNGNSITKTNRGSQAAGAAIGAVALGGVGLLLGGLTGSKTNRETLMKIELVVQTLHEEFPSHIVTLYKAINKGIDPTSTQGEAIAKESASWLGRFNQLIKLNERAAMKSATRNKSSMNIEERLSKLWALVESGGLSKQEYEARKNKLLSAA